MLGKVLDETLQQISTFTPINLTDTTFISSHCLISICVVFTPVEFWLAVHDFITLVLADLDLGNGTSREACPFPWLRSGNFKGTALSSGRAGVGFHSHQSQSHDPDTCSEFSGRMSIT